MPLISAEALRRKEGYFRQEWRWATERARSFAQDTPFIVPVALDDTSEDHPGLPEAFEHAHWARLPEGDGDDEFRRRVMSLVRAYHKRARL
jgi:hypothetical protein